MIPVKKSCLCGQAIVVNSTDELLNNTQLNGGDPNSVEITLQIIEQFDNGAVRAMCKGILYILYIQLNNLTKINDSRVDFIRYLICHFKNNTHTQ